MTRQSSFYAPSTGSDAPTIGDGLSVEIVPQLQVAVGNFACEVEKALADGLSGLAASRSEYARVLCVIVHDLRQESCQGGAV